MRRVLVDYVRRKQAEKSRGGQEMVQLDEGQGALPARPLDLMALDNGQSRLGKICGEP